VLAEAGVVAVGWPFAAAMCGGNPRDEAQLLDVHIGHKFSGT